MGSSASVPTYRVQAANVDYNVPAMRAMANETPDAMQVPVYNRQEAYDEQARINQMAGATQYANVNSPLGGYSITQDPVTGQLTINKQLSDTSTAAQQAQLGALNSYTGDPTEAANAYYNAQMAYLQPQFDRQVERAESSLTNRGLPLGSSAWNNAMDNIYDTQNRTLSSLSNQALAQGQQYQSNILNQANMLGSQVIDPSMIAGQGGAGLSDTYGNYYNSLANQAAANYENAMTRYQNAYQDEANRYQNDLNAYQNAVQNEQWRYENDLNRFQNKIEGWKQKQANKNALTSGILGAVGTIGGAALGGPLGASLGGALFGAAGSAATGQ